MDNAALQYSKNDLVTTILSGFRRITRKFGLPPQNAENHLISSVFLFAISGRIMRFSKCERELCGVSGFSECERGLCVSHLHREANDSRLHINHCEPPANQHFAAFRRHHCRSSGFIAPPLGLTLTDRKTIFNIT